MPKPKYPATLERLVAMQLANKSRGFRRKFYRWYLRACLVGRNGKQPTEEEVDAEIIREGAIQYELYRAMSIREIIQDSVAKFEHENSPKKKVEKIPKFPMKFTVFLRRAFGGRLYSERLRMFRKFLVTHYFSSAVDPEDMAATSIAAWKKDKMNNPHVYFYFIRDIEDWRPINKIQQRRKANELGRLKKIRKKFLAILQNRIADISRR